MTILVYDVAANEAGALSVLNDFYKEVVLQANNETCWVFVVSTPNFQETEHIRVLRFPWVKKSWLQRLWFDHFKLPKIIRSVGVDYIFSLQNLTVPHTNVPQIVYLHQSLPFSTYRFSFSENKLFWIYQNVIGKMIFHSIRKAEKTIVQTQWMKEACVRIAKVSEDQIDVVPPKLNMDSIPHYSDSECSQKTFFYPAGPFEYKNHRLILKACKILMGKGIADYRVIFTITGHENSYTQELADTAQREGLNIDFRGGLEREEVFKLYSESILLFPSFMETFGFPLLEARTVGAIILASDMPFSREVLSGYGNARFFGIEKEDELADCMAQCARMKFLYRQEERMIPASVSLADEVLRQCQFSVKQ